MDQFNIITRIISKYLKRHFIYDTILYYHPNCNISRTTLRQLRSQSFSSKRVSNKRRKSFNDFNSKKSKSRYNSANTI